MAKRRHTLNSSPWQTLDGQGVLRISTKIVIHNPKVEKQNDNILSTWNGKPLFGVGTEWEVEVM